METVTVNDITYNLPYWDLLPELDDVEWNALSNDVRKNGILMPVVIDDENNVVDGAHRLFIAASFGITEVPFIVRSGLTDEQKRHLAIDLNLHRRHLSQEQKRELIAKRIAADPTSSDRAIADQLHVDNKTVATVRDDLESREEIPHVPVRTDRMGRKQPARKVPKTAQEATKTMDSTSHHFSPWRNKLKEIGIELENLAATCKKLHYDAKNRRTAKVIADVLIRLRRCADDVDPLIQQCLRVDDGEKLRKQSVSPGT